MNFQKNTDKYFSAIIRNYQLLIIRYFKLYCADKQVSIELGLGHPVFSKPNLRWNRCERTSNSIEIYLPLGMLCLLCGPTVLQLCKLY